MAFKENSRENFEVCPVTKKDFSKHYEPCKVVPSIYIPLPKDYESSDEVNSATARRLPVHSKYLTVWKRARAKLKAVYALAYFAKNPQLEVSNKTKPKQWKDENFLSPGSIYVSDPLVEEVTQPAPFCMFHPNKKPRNIWNAILAVLLIYTATVMPFSMAFIEAERWGSWFVMDLVIDCLFFLDVLVNLFSCYYDSSGKLVTSKKQIFFRYLKTWLLIDLLACFPFGLIEDGDEQRTSSKDYNSFLRLLRLPRLYRLFRISRLIKMFKHYKHSELLEKIQDFLSLKHSALRLFNSFFTIMLCVHIVTCFWFFIARLEGFHPDTWVTRNGLLDKDTGTLYISAMYWAFATLSTVGYGDIHSFTNLEKMFAILWMMFGLYFFSFTIGSLSSMLARMDTKENMLINKLAVVDEFAKEANLSKQLRHRLRHALRYSTDKKGISWVDKQSIFNELPKHLRYQMALAMHQGAVRHISFFANRDPLAIASIVPFLQPIFVQHNDFVYKKDEHADEIYFIVKGKVDYRTSQSSSPFKTIYKSNYFGDIEAILGIPRKYFARAARNLELMNMPKVIIEKIKDEFPMIWDEMKNIALEREETFERILLELEEIQAFQEKDGFPDWKIIKEKVEKKIVVKKKREQKRRLTAAMNRKSEVSFKDLFEKVREIQSYTVKLSKEIKNIKKDRGKYPRSSSVQSPLQKRSSSKQYSTTEKESEIDYLDVFSPKVYS